MILKPYALGFSVISTNYRASWDYPRKEKKKERKRREREREREREKGGKKEKKSTTFNQILLKV
jgi:hypothetical protein